MQFDALTNTLTAFVGSISAGHSQMQSVQSGVLRGLLIIEVTLAALWIALDAGGLSNVFRKFLTLTFWVWFAGAFPTICKAFSDTLVQSALQAAHHPGDYQLVLDPSRIAGHGLDASEPLLQAMANVSALHVGDYIIFGLCFLIMMACFVVMGVQVVLAVVEYYVVVTLATVLIPFGVSPHTKFLAERAIGAVVSVSVKLMVLSFLMALVEPALGQLHFSSTEIKWNELLAMLCMCTLFSFLVWQIPNLVAGLLSGSPNLSAAGVAQNVASVAGLATGLVAGAIGSTRAAAGSFRRGDGAAAAASIVARGALEGARGAPAGGGNYAAGAPRGWAPRPAAAATHATQRPAEGRPSAAPGVAIRPPVEATPNLTDRRGQEPSPKVP
jgi:type IV secretion system protein TrbL